MSNQDKDYYIFNNNVIFYADKFDAEKHVKIIIDETEFKQNRYNKNNFYPIIQNTVWNKQNNLNPNVYIYFNPVKLSNNPIFTFNKKINKSKNSYNRYLLALDKSSDNYYQYKKVFKNIDNYMNNLKQRIFDSYYYDCKFSAYINYNSNNSQYKKNPQYIKPKLYYNCLSKDKYFYDTSLRKVYFYSESNKKVYYKIHFDPILKNEQNSFTYQKVFKIDQNNNITQIKYKNIDLLSKDLHKGVYISTIISLNKLYFTPSEKEINYIHPEVNYGIYPVCNQIVIHNNIQKQQRNITIKEIIDNKEKNNENSKNILVFILIILIFMIIINSIYIFKVLR